MNNHAKFTVFIFIMAWNINKKSNVWCCSFTASASPPYTAILWQKGLFGWFCLFCVFILWFSHHNVTICAPSGHIRCLIEETPISLFEIITDQRYPNRLFQFLFWYIFLVCGFVVQEVLKPHSTHADVSNPSTNIISIIG